MLTIGQLARYARTTPRAVRHYHSLGLLPEPERDAAGYRRYAAQAVIDLYRIRTLADAGVPLNRVAQLVRADQATLRSAVTEIDRELRARIAELQATRRRLSGLASGQEPYLPTGVHQMLCRVAELGVSERTLAGEREGWILTVALYPHLVGEWLGLYSKLLDDERYRELYVLTDQAFDWEPDDARLEDLAQRTVTFMVEHAPPVDDQGWDADRTAFDLVTGYRSVPSPAWDALLARVQQLMAERGYDAPG